MHTPRFCGQLSRAGLEVFHRGGLRPKRTSWLKVGTNLPLCVETHPASAIRDIRIPHRFSTQQAFFKATNKRGLLAFGQAHVPDGVTGGTSGPHSQPGLSHNKR